MVLSFLLLVAAPAPATTATKPYNPDKIVCRMESQIHSKIPVRVCQTAAMWKKLEEETEEDLRNARRNRACVGTGCNPG